jgi:hypothetical protein
MTDWSEIAKRSDDPCFVALHHDDAEALLRNLAAGRSVTERFHAGRTFLHMAAELGARKCAEVLLESGADIEAQLEFGGDSPLMLAVGYGHLEITRLLVQKGARLRYVLTPAYSPERKGVMREDYERLASEANRNIASLIPFPLEDQTEQIVQMMMEASLRTHELNALEECHDLETLRFLVDEQQMDVNQHFGACYWPLKTFAEAGDAAAVKFLLQRGAVPDFTSTGDTALHAAVGSNSEECVRLLLEAGANPNQQDVDGCVPMFRVRSHDVLDLLLRFGADPNITDQCGWKPSHWVEEATVKERLLNLETK